ncbi:MAG: hypothetical protein IPJ88_02565 [Myxococcales bacterium]|nr:MAG: hypothetical protein IPJ88_02565 [Myxococcales bacterium]
MLNFRNTFLALIVTLGASCGGSGSEDTGDADILQDQGPPIKACDPTTTCEEQGAVCGKIFDGCKDISCGACEDSSMICVSGQCECPESGNECEGRCGEIFGACLPGTSATETINCGGCTNENQNCSPFTNKCVFAILTLRRNNVTAKRRTLLVLTMNVRQILGFINALSRGASVAHTMCAAFATTITSRLAKATTVVPITIVQMHVE